MKFSMHPERWDEVIAELDEAGHTYVSDIAGADFLIFNGGTRDFPDPLPENIGFVQWPFAGVDHLIARGVMTPSVRWANAGGVYAKPVAEVALGLIIAQFHQFKTATLAGSFAPKQEIEATQQWLFHDKTVALIGAGGIGGELIEMLRPFGVRTIAVNRSGRSVEGADETHALGALDDAGDVWERADIVVLSAPLTEQTRGLLNAEKLRRMKNTALVVNVGRGALVNTDDLVEALIDGQIAGAAMDVTDPEPLPEDHPLWGMDNVLITPHIAAPAEVARLLIGAQIVENAAAFERGETMPTEVDVEAGY